MNKKKNKIISCKFPSEKKTEKIIKIFSYIKLFNQTTLPTEKEINTFAKISQQ